MLFIHIRLWPVDLTTHHFMRSCWSGREHRHCDHPHKLSTQEGGSGVLGGSGTRLVSPQWCSLSNLAHRRTCLLPTGVVASDSRDKVNQLLAYWRGVGFQAFRLQLAHDPCIL